MNLPGRVPLIILLILGAGIFFSGWSTFSPAFIENETVTLGLIAPISGPLAYSGWDMREGVKMAVDDINAAGGINGRPVKLLIKNSYGTEEGALAAYEELKTQTPLILGPVITSEVLVLAPLTEEDNVILLSPTATGAAISNSSYNVFRTAPSDLYQGRGIARLIATTNPEAEQIVVVYETNNVYAEGLKESFLEAATNNGLEVVDIIPVDPDVRNYEEIARELQQCGGENVGADAVVLLSYLNAGVGVLQAAKAVGFETDWYGPDALVDEQVLIVGGDSLEGMQVTVQGSRNRFEEFAVRYKERTRREPAWIAPSSYDATMIAAEVIRAGGYDADAIQNALNTIRYIGVTGPKFFDDNGDVSPSFDVMEIQNGSWEHLEWSDLLAMVDRNSTEDARNQE